MGCGRLLAILAAGGVWICVSGCAAGSYGPVGGSAAAAARGEALAGQACGGCHGLGRTGESHFPGAPAFRDMRFDYNALSYERRLADFHAGHVDMPPMKLSLKDLADVGAYVRSLQRPVRP